MIESLPSETAMLMAALRAQATAQHAELCNDPWAGALGGARGQELADDVTAAQPHMDTVLWTAVRSAFFDRRARAHIDRLRHCRQVVVLGAGLDTRAARLRRDGVRFFEVDHPASQATKLEQLDRLEGYPRAAATFVACDFERDNFVARLSSCGFDSTSESVVLWEGVAPYLDESSVRATLQRVATDLHPRSILLFDFLGRRFVERSTTDPREAEVFDRIRTLGEPFRWGTNDILPLLYEVGFRKVRVSSFDEEALNLTGTYNRSRTWRFQFLCEASVAGDLDAR